MSEYIDKAHNVSVLLYHYVCPAKYRRVIFDDKVDKVLIQTCKEISKRYAEVIADFDDRRQGRVAGRILASVRPLINDRRNIGSFLKLVVGNFLLAQDFVDTRKNEFSGFIDKNFIIFYHIGFSFF